MADSQLRRGFWILPPVAIAVIFLSAQLPLYRAISPEPQRGSNVRDNWYNIYDIGGNGAFGIHFGWWWALWLFALMLALILVVLTVVLLKTRAGAGVAALPTLAQLGAGAALAVSFLPVLLDGFVWFHSTSWYLGDGILDHITLWDLAFPTLAWYIMIVAYAFAFVGVARMGSPAAPAVAPSAKMNVLAALALVFGILGGWLAVVFGHLALPQIKATGQKGREMAIAGLVLGYVSVPINAANLVLFVAYLSA